MHGVVVACHRPVSPRGVFHETVANRGLNTIIQYCSGVRCHAWRVFAGKYYLQADREVNALLKEKSCDPRWEVPFDYNVRSDKRSRFYDPYNQIFPPMPPDDPTAHRYMHCVDGKHGFYRWHINGDRTTLDNPAWRSRLHEVVDPNRIRSDRAQHRVSNETGVSEFNQLVGPASDTLSFCTGCEH